MVEVFGSKPFTVQEVTVQLDDQLHGEGLVPALPDRLADAYTDKGKSFSRRLGKAFSSIERRRFDKNGLRAERIPTTASARVQQWRIRSGDDE